MAYCRRLSDWISGVCSSVLLEGVADPAEFARRAWQFGSGDEHARRAPNLGDDTPGIGTDNLRSNDQIDMFFGPLDRYDCKLLGKQELLVPANSYALHSAEVPYRVLIRSEERRVGQECVRTCRFRW